MPRKYTKSGKPRKQRADKGYTRADWKLYKQQKAYYKAQKQPVSTRRTRSTLPLTKQNAQKRFDYIRSVYINRQNELRAIDGLQPLPSDYKINDPFFFNQLDIIKHPNIYSSGELSDAHDYLYDDYNDTDYEYDFPDGDTP